MSDGHTFTTVSDMNKYLKRIERGSAFKEHLPVLLIVKMCMEHPGFVYEQGLPNRLYLNKMWKAEQDIAFHAKRLMQSQIILPYQESELNEDKIEYDVCQKKAIGLLRSTGIKIITGGPGTGKTTTINKIISVYKKMCPNKQIALCAPTGRAAQRMKEATGCEAHTIHHLLEYKVGDGVVMFKNHKNPILADCIIVDEMSMTDSYLFSILLGAIKTGALVVLVGDENQLPSVGAGNVLHDLVDSKRFEVYKLIRIFRQGEDSNIISNCYNILDGEVHLQKGDDFHIITTNTDEETAKLTQEQVLLHHNQKEPYEVQVLTPTKKYNAGTFCLNRIIQEDLNFYSQNRQVYYGHTCFKEQDKIIMTQTNYKHGYFNGDIGVLRKIESDGVSVELNNTPYFLPTECLNDMELSYAITIHKSQGSEYPIVVIPLPQNPGNMLNKNLLFTAISRAKKKVILIETKDSLIKAIKINKAQRRKTQLSFLLQQMMSKCEKAN